jgi:hypothetical protein
VNTEKDGRYKILFRLPEKRTCHKLLHSFI